jgi:large subunit ribosomal protein L9
MQVILLEKLKNLGDLGDTVSVRPGYGRNYLLPQGKALPATEENRKIYEARKAELLAKSADTMNAAKARAEKLNGVTLEIKALASEEGKLFGSVGPAEIAHAAEAAGHELHKSEVDLPTGPLRLVGSHEVAIHLHSEVDCSVTVVIEAEKA